MADQILNENLLTACRNNDLNKAKALLARGAFAGYLLIYKYYLLL